MARRLPPGFIPALVSGAIVGGAVGWGFANNRRGIAIGAGVGAGAIAVATATGVE